MKIKLDPNDVKYSKIIRAERPYCEICGKPSTQIHHFKGRRHQSVRFDDDNIWALCFTCHRKFHEDPAWAVDMMKKRLGRRYDAFILKANGICKPDKEMLKIWLGQRFNNLEYTK